MKGCPCPSVGLPLPMPDCPSSNDAVGEVMGWLGCAAALVLFISPAWTFAKIIRERSVAQYSCTPYLCSLLNCALWTTYALPMVTPGDDVPRGDHVSKRCQLINTVAARLAPPMRCARSTCTMARMHTRAQTLASH